MRHTSSANRKLLISSLRDIRLRRIIYIEKDLLFEDKYFRYLIYIGIFIKIL